MIVDNAQQRDDIGALRQRVRKKAAADGLPQVRLLRKVDVSLSDPVALPLRYGLE